MSLLALTLLLKEHILLMSLLTLTSCVRGGDYVSDLPKRLTFEEAAAATGYTARHLRRLEESGELTTVEGEKPITRQQPVRLIPRDEIERLRERRGKRQSKEGGV